jgi:hypothetical protein
MWRLPTDETSRLRRYLAETQERLEKAADAGFEVRVWNVGLEGIEMHIERVSYE